MRPDGPRDPFAGPEAGPEAPYPIKLFGPVIKGFGRGSKELGIPTANIPSEGLSSYPDLPSGVYYGFVGLSLSPSPDTSSTSVQTLPAVLSIGYNPFYKNTVRSVEIHILHDFTHDFYGAALNLLMLGYIRPEYDYVSLEALVEDIKIDCDVARRSLERTAYTKFKDEGEWSQWLKNFTWMESVDTKQVEKEVLNKE
ncbi:riboflavin kinase [Cladophialophora chaetospira]|uniref:Riboflavin kinase n=1 Tax=Cladophialophora chaetospira TaxID=386627 RepID=A0AA39CEF2_9EURO|nr:riboflavin kinase [Cladophialophora chaetospira]